MGLARAPSRNHRANQVLRRFGTGLENRRETDALGVAAYDPDIVLRALLPRERDGRSRIKRAQDEAARPPAHVADRLVANGGPFVADDDRPLKARYRAFRAPDVPRSGVRDLVDRLARPTRSVGVVVRAHDDGAQEKADAERRRLLAPPRDVEGRGARQAHADHRDGREVAVHEGEPVG